MPNLPIINVIARTSKEALFESCLFPGHVGGCGITDEVVQWMERIQNSGVEEEVSSVAPSLPTPTQNHHVPVSQPPHPNSLRDDPPR